MDTENESEVSVTSAVAANITGRHAPAPGPATWVTVMALTADSAGWCGSPRTTPETTNASDAIPPIDWRARGRLECNAAVKSSAISAPWLLGFVGLLILHLPLSAHWAGGFRTSGAHRWRRRRRRWPSSPADSPEGDVAPDERLADSVLLGELRGRGAAAVVVEQRDDVLGEELPGKVRSALDRHPAPELHPDRRRRRRRPDHRVVCRPVLLRRKPGRRVVGRPGRSHAAGTDHDLDRFSVGFEMRDRSDQQGSGKRCEHRSRNAPVRA